METYLFYTTHLIMFLCAIAIAATRSFEKMQTSVKNVLIVMSGISSLKKSKAIYRSMTKEGICINILIVKVLNVGMQISIQLLK